MSELKLLNCPFCGGEAKISSYDWGYSVKEYWIYCNPCDCASGRYHSKEEAISAWNTRKPMDNIVTKLEELKNEDVCMETSCTECKEKYKNNSKKDCYEPIQKLVLDKAINIVKQ